MEVANSSAAIENLYPALTECFAIILCGYFAGRINLISETEAKGIHTFVGTFSLPSLIFMSLVQLDFSSVNWTFLFAILLAKSIVFFAVVVVTLLVRRPLNYGRAGIFAVFCTQSNDFAVGYPIVVALYGATHPDYAFYLYLMAPISLAILNPIAFVLMEIGKRRSLQDELEFRVNDLADENRTNRIQMFKMAISLIKNIFLNPIIFMTILGIIANFIFKHRIPHLLGGTLEVLGSAFSASALFLLGLRMVGKVHKLKGATLVVPGILIIVKLLVLPIITREIINSLHAGANASETLDLSTYGFFYGTFPSAPTVFVFATQYSLDIDLIASAMVACTFISAPLMFVSAKMITLTKTDPSEYITQLKEFTLDISIAGMITAIWVIVVFVLSRKIVRIPQRITACLAFSQLLSCVGAILWNMLRHKGGWAAYTQFVISTVGVYSSRLWTAFLALSLLFLQYRSLCFVLKLQRLFMAVSWGLPIILSILFLLFDKHNSVPYDKRNPDFIYGVVQAVVTVSVLVFCFTVTVSSLIMHQRYYMRFVRYSSLSNEVASNAEPESDAHDVSNTANVSQTVDNDGSFKKCNGLPTIEESCCEEGGQSPVIDIEDLGRTTFEQNEERLAIRSSLCPSRFGCQSVRREQCNNLVQQYENQAVDNIEYIEEEPESHDPQILKHIVLLILLLCSMFVGLALSIWTLVMEEVSGIYIELCFLDATLNFGQSIIVFAIFGLDMKEISLPLLNYWKKLSFGNAEKLVLPAWHELSLETKHICEQFKTHHLVNCKKDLAKEKRWRLKVYKNVFTGRDFVSWLIEYGLAHDRVEAVNYARHLIEGRIIKHINGIYHFYDRNLLYTLD